MNSSSRIRVALIGGNLSDGGGVNRVIQSLAKLFSEKLNLETTVVGARGDAPSTYPFSSAVHVETHPEGMSKMGYARVLWGVRHRNFDYVLSFWTQDNLLAAAIFAGSRTRLILCEHTSWYFMGRSVRLLRQMLYPLAWRVLVLNDVELSYYRRFLKNVQLLSNAVPAPEVPLGGSRQKLFIAVGHLEKRKNFEDAIRAMALSGLERDGWSLAIVGKGPEEERLLTLIKDLGLTATTVHPPTADIGSWYARARFQLVTATLEVFSLVLVEGARSGVIPLCYATDGPSFILRDHADLLVPIGDYDNMAERMKRLVAEEDEDLISRAGRLQANLAQRFSTREIGQQWLRLFQ